MARAGGDAGSHARIGVLGNELNRARGLQSLVPEMATPAIRDKLVPVHELLGPAGHGERTSIRSRE